MKTYNNRELGDKLLNKFHFDYDDKRNPDHIYFILRLPSRRPVITFISHGKKDVAKEIFSKMARQLGVTTPYFHEMLDCTKSADDYLSHLQNQAE